MITSRWGKRVTFILLALFTTGVGIFSAPRIHAALLTCIYPPDKDILVNRSFEPDDFSAVSSGEAITVTIDATNSEGVALRGFYYSDQVPNGWVVNTISVSVSGSPIADYVYGQGYANEIYTGFTPHRWAVELPQGEGVFSPTHPIPASGGTARIVYTMIVSGGAGSDYSIGHEAWAGWLTTTPTGTAVFGYQEITSTLSADFTAVPRSGAAPLPVQFTDISTGGPTAWTWGFGDASPVSSQQNPTHTFTTPGAYTVTLTVTRTEPADSDTVVKPGFITVTAPSLQANFTAQPLFGASPLTVQFTDISTGGPTAWTWGFGDASPVSSQQNPTHTFTTPGAYTVTLTVTRTEPADSDTVVKPGFITVTAPSLQANFTAQPLFGASPLTVQFTDISTGGPTAWTWGFGDASPVSSQQNPTHTFTTPGAYTVTLTVTRTEPADSDTVVNLDFITVTAPSLQANFTAQPWFGASPLTVQFTDISTGGPTAWTWGFGDASPVSSQQNPTHTFTTPGAYTVTLTVTRTEPADSDTVVKPGFITVTAPPLQANFTAQPLFGASPLTVQFTDISVGNILTSAWDFGDEGTALLPGTASLLDPTHTYSALGYYTVTLTVQDAYGSDTLVQPRYIHVTDVVYNLHLPLVLKQSRTATLKTKVIGGKHE